MLIDCISIAKKYKQRRRQRKKSIIMTTYEGILLAVPKQNHYSQSSLEVSGSYFLERITDPSYWAGQGLLV